MVVVQRDLGQPIQLARLAALAVVVGLLAGAGAAVFVAGQHYLTHLLWHTLPHAMGLPFAPWWLTLALPVVGAVLTWQAMRLPGHGGHGPLEAPGLDIGPREAVSVLLAALASLCFGAVLGPEAPLMAIGTAAGAALFRGRDDPARQVLMIAGATAAAGAVLGNPLVTTILVLEIALAAGPAMTTITVILPMLSALAGGYLLQVGVGPWTGLGDVQLTMSALPAYPNVRLVDLVVGLVLAVAVAALGLLAPHAGALVQRLAAAAPLPVLIGAGVVTGTSGLLVSALTGLSPKLVVLAGQSAMGAYLTLPSLGVAAIVLIGKFVAFAVCLGGGFRGGALFPSIALGTILAGSAGLLMGVPASPALVATAIAAATGAMKQPFTGMVLGVMLTISTGPAVTVPAILGAVVGTLVRLAGDQFWPTPSAPHAG